MLSETMTFKNVISSKEELRSMMGNPSERVQRKVIHHIDQHCRNYIALSPFMVMSTSDKNGNCDVSPRGDQPGFVMVLNDQQLLIPERPGNKRMDSMMNILENPHVGLQFLIPGMGETLRINGKASLVRDEELLKKLAIGEKLPLVAIAVEVEECFMHCAKAMIRSGLWKPETWQEKDSLPRGAQILFDHCGMKGTTVDEVEESLHEGYQHKLY